MNIKGLTQSTLIIIGIVAVVSAISLFQRGGSTNDSLQPMPTAIQSQIASNSAVDITLDVLQALSNYYLATVTVAEEDDDFVGIMTSLLNQNKYLEAGKNMIDQHSNHSNRAIKVAIEGSLLGADQIIKANNELVQFIRNAHFEDPNVIQELQYKTASYLSNQKEGYKTIAISAPWITSALFEPAKSKNPIGKIPYTITKEERERLLEEIERLFGEELKEYKQDIENNTGKYNAILFSVDAIRNNLFPETYEEAKDL